MLLKQSDLQACRPEHDVSEEKAGRRRDELASNTLCSADFEERSDEGRQTGLLGGEAPWPAVASATEGYGSPMQARGVAVTAKQ
ncbi:hypothetical protein [Ferrimonas pelagia]|uniref:hypothetical protein n=1 Tax=Ferrimonas pelagia TaxID=1177826 RepID=UPI0031EEE9DA